MARTELTPELHGARIPVLDSMLGFGREDFESQSFRDIFDPRKMLANLICRHEVNWETADSRTVIAESDTLSYPIPDVSGAGVKLGIIKNEYDGETARHTAESIGLFAIIEGLDQRKPFIELHDFGIIHSDHFGAGSRFKPSNKELLDSLDISMNIFRIRAGINPID